MEVLRLPEHLETQGVSSVQRERSWSLGCTHKLNEQRIIAPLHLETPDGIRVWCPLGQKV